MKRKSEKEKEKNLAEEELLDQEAHDIILSKLIKDRKW